MDGDLHLTPGYLPGSGLFLAMPENLRVPPVPRHPTEEDLRRARCALIDLLADFPFTGPAEMAHAISVLLLPFLRDLISGPTPFFLIEKPTPGTGGSLLAEVLLLPIVGRSVGSLTEGRDEDEWRKRLTAKLVTSPVAVVIDNLKRPLEASALASAITATFWEDRLLGGSEIVRVPVGASGWAPVTTRACRTRWPAAPCGFGSTPPSSALGCARGSDTPTFAVGRLHIEVSLFMPRSSLDRAGSQRVGHALQRGWACLRSGLR